MPRTETNFAKDFNPSERKKEDVKMKMHTRFFLMLVTVTALLLLVFTQKRKLQPAPDSYSRHLLVKDEEPKSTDDSLTKYLNQKKLAHLTPKPAQRPKSLARSSTSVTVQNNTLYAEPEKPTSAKDNRQMVEARYPSATSASNRYPSATSASNSSLTVTKKTENSLKATTQYPSWWTKAWPKSATSGLLDTFTGDNPLFPPCSVGKSSKSYFGMIEPRNYLPNSKNPCWYDRPAEKAGLHCIPYFYVAGVAKCGTSDLFRRIRLHPDVMVGTRKEYHWWDRGRYGDYDEDADTDEEQDVVVGGIPFKQYSEMVTGRRGIFLVNDDIKQFGKSEKLFGDGSPSYLWDIHYWNVLDGNQHCTEPRVVIGQHIYHVFPEVKIILTFRHPTPRLYSRFLSRIPRVPILRKADSQTFHKLVSHAVYLYRQCFERWSIRHCAYNLTLYDEAVVRLVEGMYPVFMADWLRIFPRNQILILRYEDYANDMEGQLRKVFNFLGLAPLNVTAMANVMEHVVVNMGQLYGTIGPMMPETSDILNDFYEPFIDKFAEMLDDQRFLWRDKDHL